MPNRLAACIITLTTLHASAADPAQDWLLDAWTQANDGSQLENVRVEWLTQHVELPTADELQRLRRVTKNRPEHPERARLETYERRLANGPDSSHVTVWLGSRGTFRRNIDENETTFADIVVVPGSAWSLSPRQLTVINSTTSGFPKGHNYAPWEQTLRGTIGGFSTGALSIRMPGVPLQLDTFTREGDRWVGVFNSTSHPVALRIEGTWNDDAHVGRPLTATVARCDLAPEETGRRWEFTDWRPGIATIPEMCWQQSEFAPDGQLIKVESLLSIDEITNTELSRVIERPSDHTDAVRGPLAYSAVHTFSGTGAPSVVQVRDGEGNTLAVIPEEDFPANRNRRLLRVSSVVAVAGCAMVVAGFWLRKRQLTS
ncbi:MAG: hypothetical protein H6810_06495 [Phycisphaeraceae bacterium]|nr:MAG: hypothetical protein H6810_06495 [Phycisphaeraceae bacterium]